MESGSGEVDDVTPTAVNGPPAPESATSEVQIQGLLSCGSGTSSENEGVCGESEESEESVRDSTDAELPDGEENGWSGSDESESSVHSSEGVGETDQMLFPAVLPATSVQFMAQSVGVNMTLSAAADLGRSAMNNLRRLLMLANQLRKHDQSQGLTTDHVAMAEKLMGVQSFGYGSTYSMADFKPVGKGFSVLQDTREIDLVGTTLHARKNPKPLRKMSKMVLSHHQLPTAIMDAGKTSTDFAAEELPERVDMSPLGEETDSDSSSWYFESDEEVKTAPALQAVRKTKAKKFRKRSEVLSRARRGITAPSAPNTESLTQITTKLEKVMERLLILNDEDIPENGMAGTDPNTEKSSEVPTGVVVGIEWVDYMKVFMASFFYVSSESLDDNGRVQSPIPEPEGGTLDGRSSTKKVSPKSVENEDVDMKPTKAESRTRSRRLEVTSDDFKLIIRDMTTNGSFPVLGILLNFFNDYLDGRFGGWEVEGLEKILSVLEATLKCPVRTDTIYLYKIFKTLLNLVSCPPPVELHQKIAQIFILLIKNEEKEFSTEVCVWTCEFITGTFETSLTSCLHLFELNMMLMNLGLTLIIGLESIGIHAIVAMEWHTRVLELVRALNRLRSLQIAELKQGESSLKRKEPTEIEEPRQGGGSSQGHGQSSRIIKRIPSETSLHSLMKPQTEETLMAFFRLVLKGYVGSLSSGTILEIQSTLEESFGERMIPYVSSEIPEPFRQFKKRKIVKTHSATGTVPKRIRNITWETKSITVGRIPK